MKDKIVYCKNCVMPETKPDLLIDEEGICNACRSYMNRKEVDWDVRLEELKEILDRYKSKDQSNWDCIVPVRDPISVAKEVEKRNAGEIILSSIDLDGTMNGYDIDLIWYSISSRKEWRYWITDY